MTEAEKRRIAERIANAARQIEQTAARVAQKQASRGELTGKVTDSAAELSNYLLTRARRNAA